MKNFEDLNNNNEIDFSTEDKNIMIDKVENFYVHCSVTDAIEIRQAFALLEPEQNFEIDDEIYKLLKMQSDFYSQKLNHNYEKDFFDNRSFDAYERYIQTTQARKLIFPEKNNELYNELEETQIHKRLISELEDEDNNLFNIYLLLQDMKILFPETIDNLQLIELYNLNEWKKKHTIKNEIEFFLSEELYESALMYIASINIVNKDNKIILDEKEKKMFLEYINKYKEVNSYGDYATYMLLLKIILAKDITITKEKFHLIF